MEFRHLRCFTVLAEELHFGRAAQRLAMTQPPLSLNIQQLEASVGARLFDLYRGEKLGVGKKSLAYQLTYQAFDRTLGVADAAAIRKKIVKLLGFEIGAQLRDS